MKKYKYTKIERPEDISPDDLVNSIINGEIFTGDGKLVELVAGSAGYEFVVGGLCCVRFNDMYTREEIKTRTITLELPEPMREEPEAGTEFYIVVGSYMGGWEFLVFAWGGNHLDKKALLGGRAYKTKEDAQAAVEALNKGFKL